MNVRNQCYVANVGDSWAILFTDEHGSNIWLSTDHKPDREDEWERIWINGGSIYQSSIERTN